MRTQILMLAKEPIAGRVKTRLCPPCTPAQAAAIAAAAIEDTRDAVDAAGRFARILVADGVLAVRPGWTHVSQCGGGLDERIAYAFAGTARGGLASLLIGMDTPQVTPDLLTQAALELSTADAALGLAADGGWWALALRNPADAAALRGIPTSRDDTGRRTLEALRTKGLRVAMLPVLRDVDTAADALEVAEQCPATRFARAVADHIAVVAR